MAFLIIWDYYARAERITEVIARMKKSALKMIVTQKSVFSIPRLAVKTPPASDPVKTPSPAPLL
jgi:hypothetical protein